VSWIVIMGETECCSVISCCNELCYKLIKQYILCISAAETRFKRKMYRKKRQTGVIVCIIIYILCGDSFRLPTIKTRKTLNILRFRILLSAKETKLMHLSRTIISGTEVLSLLSYYIVSSSK